jgi:type II secretory pathway component GspD/PulD (secretin)
MESAVTDRQSSVIDVSANEAYASGVSWAAIIAGAFVVAALSLILLALGSGLGLSSVSP